MSFLTVKYLAFIAILFIIYYVTGRIAGRFQWVLLLVASYIFYSLSSAKFLFFLICSTFTTWFVAIRMDGINTEIEGTIKNEREKLNRDEKKRLRQECETRKRRWVVLAIIINIGILFVMKYANFMIVTANSIFGTSVNSLSWIVLPLGLSFYTFQSLGYCIDVYRGAAEAEHNFFKYALYVSFFPQICEGPIGDYCELYPQLIANHRFSYNNFVKGLVRILLGTFKKVVVADSLAIFIDPVYANYNDYSGAVIVIATLLYGIQLYADFSGYMDIALGTSECLGIHLMENFDTPYFSKSITEFWRRWHISLGRWFRNYLYYPVLRSKFVSSIGKALKKKGYKKLSASLTATIGLIVTWTVIGAWHGAGYKYIAYGWFHGTFIILTVWLEDYYKNWKRALHIKEGNAWSTFQIIRTYLIVSAGYVIFRAASLMDSLHIYKRIIGDFIYDGWSNGLLNTYSIGEWVFIISCIAVCFFFELIETEIKVPEWIMKRRLVLRWGLLYVLLGITTIYFLVRPADAGNFIYFNF